MKHPLGGNLAVDNRDSSSESPGDTDSGSEYDIYGDPDALVEDEDKAYASNNRKRKHPSAGFQKRQVIKRKKESGELDQYASLGKWIPIFLNPWIDIKTVFEVGLHKSGKGQFFTSGGQNVGYHNTHGFMDGLSSEDIIRNVQCFQQILEHSPSLLAQLDQIVKQKDHARYDALINVISSSARSTLVWDFDLVKKGIPDWLSKDAPQSSPIGNNCKRNRGRRDPFIAKLWCPRVYFKDLFDQQQQLNVTNSQRGTSLKLEDVPTSIVSEIMDNAVFLSDQDYFLALYDVQKIDLDDPWAGLLESHVLLHICRALLFGKNMKSTGPGRPGRAKTYNVTKITPAIIAYTCLQLRFALSNVTSWTEKDQDIEYNFKTFYETILDIFAAPSERSKALLAFWTQEIFGLSERPIVLQATKRSVEKYRKKGFDQPRDRDLFRQKVHSGKSRTDASKPALLEPVPIERPNLYEINHNSPSPVSSDQPSSTGHSPPRRERQSLREIPMSSSTSEQSLSEQTNFPSSPPVNEPSSQQSPIESLQSSPCSPSTYDQRHFAHLLLI
ncbi:hypothetical protein K435DRAFT_971188 [Dendrothele bispora CBS 962.96]|uniref:Fungal-type protein kinase domain-containing protein n=1 Tax=Dendrothele bispora (strain CBS 962.96) TaxID=1314807 RepID=A0A4V4HCR4_DENBC|nr:hypothetical protein K435DRAFT_971188 [Dendrothele bispora CBS 962.96]